MSTPDTPRDPRAAGDPGQPAGADVAHEPIGSTAQFQAFASRTEAEDERAGEQVTGPDIPDVIPEDSPVSGAGELGFEPAAFGADPDAAGDDAAAPVADSGEPAFASPHPSAGLPAPGAEPTDLPPVRTDRGRALLLAAAVFVLVAAAVLLLILLL